MVNEEEIELSIPEQKALLLDVAKQISRTIHWTVEVLPTGLIVNARLYINNVPIERQYPVAADSDWVATLDKIATDFMTFVGTQLLECVNHSKASV